jgi:hypothetical protein
MRDPVEARLLKINQPLTLPDYDALERELDADATQLAEIEQDLGASQGTTAQDVQRLQKRVDRVELTLVRRRARLRTAKSGDRAVSMWYRTTRAGNVALSAVILTLGELSAIDTLSTGHYATAQAGWARGAIIFGFVAVLFAAIVERRPT